MSFVDAEKKNQRKMQRKGKKEYTVVFKNPILEATTHIHPVVPLLIWVPIIIFMLFKASQEMSLLEISAWILPGLLVWTLVEYLFHRYLFHWQAKSKFGKQFVYLAHGIHHDEPDDASRLVMPPMPALLWSVSLFLIFRVLLGPQNILPFFSFFLVGYLCYDYIHYGTHHFACKGPIMKYLKRHHMLHHHLLHEGKFGVSSPLWDFVFGTYGESQKSPKKVSVQ